MIHELPGCKRDKKSVLSEQKILIFAVFRRNVAPGRTSAQVSFGSEKTTRFPAGLIVLEGYLLKKEEAFR